MRRKIFLVAMLAAITGTVIWLAQPDDPGAAASRPNQTTPTAAPAAADQSELDRLIDLFAARAAERESSIEYRQLGNLLLERAGQRSDLADYRGALDAFASALALDPDHPASLVGQGRAALGVHDFAIALTAANELDRVAPDDPDALALIGDASYAVGDDERAADAFARLESIAGPDPAVLVRLAELGEGGESDRLGRDALAAAEQAVLAPADLAFYQTFVGRQAFDRGDLATAADLLEQAVTNAPDDHGALGELARVRAAAGEIERAIELLERANAIIPEPDHLTLQGDLRTLLGDDDRAASDHAAGVALANLDDDHRRAWARSLATYHLDHLDHLDPAGDQGGEPTGGLAVAIEIAEAERAIRQDAGAHDLMAWAAYRAGDLTTARAEIDVALSLDRTDATILYHGARISAAEGDIERASSELEVALEINPGFDPLLALDARQLRSDLGRR